MFTALAWRSSAFSFCSGATILLPQQELALLVLTAVWRGAAITSTASTNITMAIMALCCRSARRRAPGRRPQQTAGPEKALPVSVRHLAHAATTIHCV
jgi:hypothetical protein